MSRGRNARGGAPATRLASLRQLRRLLARFSAAEGAQVALTFSLTLVPISLGIGAGLDLSRALATKSALQQATDSAALALVKTASTQTSQQLSAQVLSYIQGAASDTGVTLVSPPSLLLNNTELCIDARAARPTTLMQIGGVKTITVSAHACAVTSGGTYEIALALDNTGSMSTYDYVTGRSKMQNEVLAAKNLVNTIFNGQSTSTNYKLSIVPFTSSVNVGTTYANASFVDLKGASSIHWENFPKKSNNTWQPVTRFDLFSGVSINWGGCFEERPQPYSLTDDPPNTSVPDTLFVPLFAPDEESGSRANGYSSPNNSYLSSSSGGVCSKWPDGTNSTSYDSGGWTYADGTRTWGDGQAKLCKYKGQRAYTSSYAPGPNWGCDSTLPTIQLLTNTASTLTSKLNAMSANGNTNLVSGFMWAWRTISPNGPFTPYSTIKPYTGTAAQGNTKAIVFMTDGVNNWQPDTRNVNDGTYSAFGYYHNARLGKMPITTYGYTSNQYPTSSNQRQYLDAAFLQACTNAKAAGVKVYTIGFSVPNDPIDQEGINLLAKCASSSTMAYVATDGNQVVNIFGQIATGLDNPRLVN